MAEHIYACNCGRPIQQECVEGVIPGGHMELGRSVIVCFRCECAPAAEQTRRFYAMPDAIGRITDGDGLPYRNPNALIPVPADHPDLKAWQECIRKHGHDIGAFIAAMDG